MPARKSADLVQVGLRLREGLRQKVVSEARKNKVSISAEIGRRLQESLEAAPRRALEDLATDMSNAWGRVRKKLENA